MGEYCQNMVFSEKKKKISEHINNFDNQDYKVWHI